MFSTLANNDYFTLGALIIVTQKNKFLWKNKLCYSNEPN